MRLSIVCDRWDENGGGCERYLAALASYAVSMGISVDIYASRGASSGRSPNMIRFYDATEGPSIAGTVLATVPFRGATHYQLHSGLYSSSFEAERQVFRSPVRKLLYPLAQCFNARRRRLLRDQDRCLGTMGRPKIMVFSRLSAAGLQERYGIEAKSLCINPHGADLKRFFPFEKGVDAQMKQTGARNKEKRDFLFVAHNFPLKGLHCLLEAMGRLKQRGLHISLQIAGAGPVKQWKRLAAGRGILSQVHFLGDVSQHLLADCYSRSVALVHPTFYDPCSLVVPEALVCGCPVITTRRNGASELMESGREGFVLDDPRDIEGLCRSLLILTNSDRAEEMGRAALQLRPRLDIGRHLEKTMQWLGVS